MKEQEEDKPKEAELFLIFQEELKGYKKMMSQALESVLENEISSYPIFVVHQQEVELGIELIDKDKVNGNWSMQLSTLEEFVSKNIIDPERINTFKATYKSTDNYFCLFSLSELGAQFVFLPRK